MSISSFIKENRVLFAGLTLPVFLILLMALAKELPSLLTEAPKVRVLYYNPMWGANGKLDPIVGTDGKLAVDVTVEPPKGAKEEDKPKVDVFVYDPKAGTSSKFTITVDKKNKPIIPTELSSLQLSKEETSPEGFVFESYRYSSHSLVTELMGAHGSYDNGPYLTKDGATFPIKTDEYVSSPSFIGWEVTAPVTEAK